MVNSVDQKGDALLRKKGLGKGLGKQRWGSIGRVASQEIASYRSFWKKGGQKGGQQTP